MLRLWGSAGGLLCDSSDGVAAVPPGLRGCRVVPEAPVEGEDCCVCLAPQSEPCVKTHCGHVYHAACLAEHMRVRSRATCPMCRSSLRGPTSVLARATSGRPLELLECVPSRFGKCHLDRDYWFLMLGGFANKPRTYYLRTCNEDKHTPSTRVMWVLDSHVPTVVYLNFRSRCHVTETGADVWLQEQGWAESTMRSTVSTGMPDGLYWGPVFFKAFDKGAIELMGSNSRFGTYFVFVEVQDERVAG